MKMSLELLEWSRLKQNKTEQNTGKEGTNKTTQRQRRPVSEDELHVMYASSQSGMPMDLIGNE